MASPNAARNCRQRRAVILEMHRPDAERVCCGDVGGVVVDEDASFRRQGDLLEEMVIDLRVRLHHRADAPETATYFICLTKGK